MDVLTAGTTGGGGEAWSYHSQPQLAARQQRSHMVHERDKENRPISKLTMTMDVQHQRVRRPFQDNTNGQASTVPTPLKKPAAGETHNVGKQQQQRSSLKELVPPLNVARLQPVQQELRNGVVSEHERGIVGVASHLYYLI